MAIENIRSGLAGLRATKQKQATMEQQFGFAEDMINIATDTFAGLEAAKEASETAWDEYEAGYAELGGDVSNIKRPSKFKQTLQSLIPGGSEGYFDKRYSFKNQYQGCSQPFLCFSNTIFVFKNTF